MKKQVLVNGKLILDDVVRNEGESTRCIFAKVPLKNCCRINVTYDCLGGNLIIHELYKISEDERDIVTALIMACIRNLIEEDMFGRAVEAMDRYSKALEMWFPEEFVDACDDEMMKDLQEIQNAGLMEKFYEFYPEH